MLALKRNVMRLFDNEGKLFLIALDHPMYFGALQGLENTVETAEKFLNTPVDGFILSPGSVLKLPVERFYRKKIVMRVSCGGSKLGEISDVHPVFVEPSVALSMGVDAIITMMIVGGEDHKSMEIVGNTIWKYHEYGIPVIVEILPIDPSKISDTDLMATGARIASELGADVVKVFYTPDFERVVSHSNCRVILAGGPRNEMIESIAEKAVNSGVDGFAFGRNVFSHDDPIALVEKLEGILRG